MSKLSSITSLEALNNSIVMKKGAQSPEIVGKMFGGRYMKLNIEVDGKQKEVKVSVNDLVKKMRELTKADIKDEKLSASEKDAGEKICNKVISLKNEDVPDENKLQAFGTRIARFKNLFFGDKKQNIDHYKGRYIEIVKNDPPEMILKINLEDLGNLNKHVITGDFEAVKKLIALNPQLPMFTNENGNSILHMLASNLPHYFIDAEPDLKEKYQKILQYLLPLSDMHLKNSQGITPLEILEFVPEKHSQEIQNLFKQSVQVVPAQANVMEQTISLEAIEQQLRETLGQGSIADAMVRLGRDFMRAAQSMVNGPMVTHFDVSGDLNAGVTLKMKLDRPVKIEAGPLVKQINNLHPKALNPVVKRFVNRLVSGGTLVMNQEITIKTHRDKNAFVMTFGGGLYVDKGSSRTAVKSIHFTNDPKKGVMLEFDKSRISTPRKLKGVLKSLADNPEGVQWSKMRNQL